MRPCAGYSSPLGRLGRLPWEGVLFALLLALGWELSARLGWVSVRMFPPLTEVGAVFWQANLSGELPRALGATLWRMGLGFGLAAACTIPLGLWLGLSARAEALCSPTLEFLRSLPPAVVILPAMLFLGIDSGMKVFVIFFACSFPILLNTMDGAASVPRLFRDTARTLGLGRLRTLWGVLLPATLPGVFSGLKTAMPVAFIVAIVVEMIGGTDGIGHYILRAQRTFAVHEMYAGILQIGVAGFVLDFLARRLEGSVLVWYRGWKGEQRL